MNDRVGSIPAESPLVSNRTMQQMYEGIVQSRMLDEFLLRARSKKTKLPTKLLNRGQEACRVSVLIGLDPEDFTGDTPGRVTTALLRGVALQTIVTSATSLASSVSTGKNGNAAARTVLGSLLPAAADSIVRLRTAMGVALALKRLDLHKVVVVFADALELKPSGWREIFRCAAREELPMLFVILPAALETAKSRKATLKEKKQTKIMALSEQATACGVSGIPVDASDAVALYRVAQESIGRARGNGGPALIECLHLGIAERNETGKKKRKLPFDSAVALGQTLLNRKVCSQQWLAAVPSAFQARLDTL